MKLVLAQIGYIVLSIATGAFAFTTQLWIESENHSVLLTGLAVFLLSVVTGRLSMMNSTGMVIAMGIGNAILVFAGFTFGPEGGVLLGAIMTVVYIISFNIGVSVPMLGSLRSR